VIAAHQRHPQSAADQRAHDPRRARRADVDQVERPVGDRLYRRRQARDPDPQPGVVRHVELGHGRQAPVDVRVGAHHLDFESRHPAAAYLLERPGDSVGAADSVGQNRHPRGLAVLQSRVELGLLVCQEGCRRGVGDRRYAAVEQALRRSHQVRTAAGRRHRVLDREAELALVHAAGPPVEV
jgi:hypothetical protein